jgi:hypothetical protein
MPTGPVTASDGLPARLIKPHSLEKFDRHRKYCTIFNNGMKNSWPDNRGYLALFAAQAAFNRLAFVELNPTLAAALERRFLDRGVSADRALVRAADRAGAVGDARLRRPAHPRLPREPRPRRPPPSPPSSTASACSKPATASPTPNACNGSAA